jgi:hypothetical protein
LFGEKIWNAFFEKQIGAAQELQWLAATESYFFFFFFLQQPGIGDVQRYCNLEA